VFASVVSPSIPFFLPLIFVSPFLIHQDKLELKEKKKEKEDCVREEGVEHQCCCPCHHWSLKLSDFLEYFHLTIGAY
jgi:hypothetical protein